MVGIISYCNYECIYTLYEGRERVRKLELYKMRKREIARKRMERTHAKISGHGWYEYRRHISYRGHPPSSVELPDSTLRLWNETRYAKEIAKKHSRKV